MEAITKLVLAMMVIAGGADRALADEKTPVRLSGKDVRNRVIGKVVTDGAHWSDYFEKSGTLVSWSIGRKQTGSWKIRGDELCLAEAAGESSTCYQVWLAGDEISLRLEGIDTTFTGYLRKYEGQ